ncbi:hypothetical protein AAFF_G00027000 [Aldrovandia affinis]|uniref:Uncharacterized protein n=1 Tax=Aldrovandia affinis TaxID=143900 RepID=A0AAD7R2Z0_9TELE|nr:hypothetical protein AAFF_G00027000 [Aldrovandia affinis]
MRRYAADISSLAEEFQQRFRDFAAIEQEITLFPSPFSVDPDDAPDHLQLELIELQCGAECRIGTNSSLLSTFTASWITAADISSLAEEFQQRFRDFAAIEQEITLFSSASSVDPDDAPDHLQLELIELQCGAEWRIGTNSSLLSTFTASWIKAGCKRFEHLLRKC